MRRASALLICCAAALSAEPGDPAPPVGCADGWVNVAAGEQPSLKKLKGKLVLLEFWFTT